MQIATTGGNNSMSMGPVKGLVTMNHIMAMEQAVVEKASKDLEDKSIESIKDIPKDKLNSFRQAVFSALRGEPETSGDLSPNVQKLITVWGLKEPVPVQQKTGVNAYA